ncbi:MAG: hypothetical protein H7842_00120 [Gammaproteobacteria bacterium SHHR-1]|uniref:hypothetical protein n=1 Tax=Magnetovirga frankeli TaxID=947516 RepID=UPI001293E014|nr:hypothetical protein D5125_16475 [gamma proteobacterium SS-5]
MESPAADIIRIIDAFSECAKDFIAFWEDQGKPELDSTNEPDVILDALLNLLDMFYAHEMQNGSLSEDDLSELGNYGLTMLEALTLDAQSVHYPHYLYFETIAFPLALWLARNGAELDVLGPVVNTLARMANQLNQPDELENLFSQSSEIADALSVGLTQDLEQSLPGAPWSVFLINRGIIATRSLNPDCIISAYESIIEYVPELSHEFFAEAMEQMELLDYPPQVRMIVERYLNQTNANTLLH